ncbi:MAG: glucose-6-phosphate isomerase [Tenericutes bacterium]|nr:glucose-6-phosphate isomerase [Mycoplasmatota bacterium]MDD6942309.1 glucose-6-phosphate isomerase [bacterium]MDY2696622.1 glucose-6-phosphate isomerase [Bacilli bacterium]
MVKFDFDTYSKNYIDEEIFNKNFNRKEEVFSKFNNSEMIGWTRKVDNSIIDEILSLRNEVKSNANCFVVVGIGGSYLGSKAINDIFSDYYEDPSFEIIYLGNNLSSKYIRDTLEYLKNKDFYVNVISKSGNTKEVEVSYELIKSLMNEKYSEEEKRKRIIITTDSNSGKLREEVKKFNYRSFVIPSDIGGRYSLITPAHLLPLSFKLDIKKLVNGFYSGLELKDEAMYYASIRKSLFDTGKYIENYSVYEENFNYFLEWLKQLFAESEGKDFKGIFPVSTIGTRDLHSLGQFIQEGNPVIFETFIKILNVTDFKYENRRLDEINNIVLDSVVQAHIKSGVCCNIIEVSEIDEESIGLLCAFFMLSAAYSGYLFDVNPFNQPGVEVYKECLRNNL